MYINDFLKGPYSDAPLMWKIKHLLYHYFHPHSIRLNLISALIRKDLAVIANTKINGAPGQTLVHISSNKTAFVLQNTLIGNCDPMPKYLIEI